MPGIGEWIIILLIVLLVFGANRLPQLGDALGRTIKNFCPPTLSRQPTSCSMMAAWGRMPVWVSKERAGSSRKR